MVAWRQPRDHCRYLAQTTPFVMLEIKTIADLDKLREQECAVVFIWVDWAIHARHSASTAERMITDWNSEHPGANIDLSQIDLSEQSGNMWEAVHIWLESQSVPDIGPLMFGGVGSIMWVRLGTIVQYVINANSETVNGMVALMSQCFSGQEIDNAK